MHPREVVEGKVSVALCPSEALGRICSPPPPRSGGCQRSLACGCISITLILKAGIFKSVCSICTPPAPCVWVRSLTPSRKEARDCI